MIPCNLKKTLRLCACLLLLGATGACNTLRTTATPPPAYYSLDRATHPAAATAATRSIPASAPTLMVTPPHAVSGFDSRRMIYVRTAQKLEYFARNEWIDTPARMLAPLIVAATTASGAFRAVVPTPSSASGDLRLDTNIIRLQQEFGGGASRVRFTLRADLVESSSRRVVAWREFDVTVAATSEDPQGGASAAAQAVAAALEELARFCGETAGSWRPARAGAPQGGPAIP
jgi:cholesterol transport system auxiliary component